MIALDSIKLKIPISDVEIQNIADFKWAGEETIDGDLIKEKYKLLPHISKSIIGLKDIEFTQGDLLLEISAKILLDNYLYGINKNTLEECFSKIKSIIIIKNYSKIEMLRGDFNANLEIGCVRNTIDALRLARSNVGFKVDEYRSSKNNGLAFIGTQKSYKNRQIYYNKQVEMSQAKNRDFFKSCQNGNKLFNSLTNILRVEQNVTSFAQIRKSVGIEDDTLLTKILNSNSNPLLVKHKEIVKFANQILLFDEYKNQTKIQLAVEYMGFKGILDECQGDINLAVAFLKSFMEKNHKQKDSFYRYKKKLLIYYSGYYYNKINSENSESGYILALKTVQEKLENL